MSSELCLTLDTLCQVMIQLITLEKCITQVERGFPMTGSAFQCQVVLELYMCDYNVW